MKKSPREIAGFLISNKLILGYNTFFLEGAKCACANFHADFFTINNKRLLLKVWFPNFLRMTLRKADVVAVLLAFTCNITFFHKFIPNVLVSNSTT